MYDCTFLADRRESLGVEVCFSFFFFSSRRRHTRFDCDWSSDVCSSDLSNKELQREHFRLPANLIVDEAGRGAEVTDGGTRAEGYEVTKKWHPKIPDYEIGRASCRERV